MLLTLGATGATLLVAAILLGGPVLSACTSDSRGAVACLRDLVGDKFRFGRQPAAAPEALPTQPVVADATPTEPVAPVPVPETRPAEPARPAEPRTVEQPAVAAPAPAEPLVAVIPAVPPAAPPPAAEPQPEQAEALTPIAAPGPQVSETPVEAATPSAEPELQVTETPVEVATPPDTIALAAVMADAADTATALSVAPSFVPPAPPIELDGVPPDLQAAVPAPEAQPVPKPAPALTLSVTPAVPAPPLPTETAVAAESEPTPAFVLPVTPAVPAPPPAPLPTEAVVAAEPEPAPALVVPVTPAVPALPPRDPRVAALSEPQSASPELPPAPPPVSAPPDLAVAATDPVVPAVDPPAAAPVLAPSIDAVEIDGAGNFIAGNGPAGAMMRLYVDGIPAGVSSVEGGRWLVEGTDLLDGAHQTLRVEALDPMTGKVLGEASVDFQRPPEPAVVPDEAAPLEPAMPDEVSQVPPVVPDADLPAPAAELPEPPIVETPVPPIIPAVPFRESPSVTTLKPSGGASITTLPRGKPSDEAVVTLGARPGTPAVQAEFTLPTRKAAADVMVLHAVPIGDPDAGRFVSGKAIIRRGDTLWDIAHRYYGRGVHFRTIFRANRELIARPGRIYPGQVLELPLVYDD